MADEEGLRREAVRRRLQGESAAAIGRDLGRTERWVYAWVARYETGQPQWFRSRSRAPLARPTGTPEELVSLVLAARDRLQADPRAQRGAAAIAWELVAMGMAVDDVPATRTIERIVARSGRSLPRRALRSRYEPRGTPYPFRARRAGVGVLHEIDPVGPRWLDGGAEVHVLNLIDVGSHRVAIEALAHPTPHGFAEHLLTAWRRLGIPQVAQLDNAPSLRGDIGRPRVFGPVVRLCLDLGVAVRYIPLEEPWRNGAIEHFQDVFDKSFYRTERFRDLDHLSERALVFEVFHNTRHRYSVLSGRTPDDAWTAAAPRVHYPPDDYVIPAELPHRGRIDVVRLIRSDQVLNLFGQKIHLPAHTVLRYVVATIHVRAQRLVVTCSRETVLEATHYIR